MVKSDEKQLILVLKKGKKETLIFFFPNFSSRNLAYYIKNIVLNITFWSFNFLFLTIVGVFLVFARLYLISMLFSTLALV